MSMYPITRISNESAPAASRFFNIPELLGEVFMHRVIDDAQDSYALHIYPPGGLFPVDQLVPSKRAPLSLTRVNRHWRRVVNSNPLLWSHICFPIPESICYRPGQLKKYASIITQSLIRSKKVPVNLRLIIYWPPGYYGTHGPTSKVPPQSDRILLDIMHTLIRHQGLWESISLHLPLHAMIGFYDLFVINFGIQKPLCPFWTEPEKQKDERGFRNLMMDEPDPKLMALSLRRQKVDGFQRDILKFPEKFPLSVDEMDLTYMEIRFDDAAQGSRLKELYLSNVHISDEEIAKLPLAFPLLEVLIVTYDSAEFEDCSEDSSASDQDILKRAIVFNNLKELRSFTGSLFPLEAVTAPALECLEVDEAEIDWGVEYSPFFELDEMVLSFLERSNPPLKKFTFWCHDSSWVNPKGSCVTKVLQDRHGNIEDLSLSGCYLDHDELYKDLSDPAFCPHLRSIYTYFAPDLEVLLDFIKRRCRSTRGFSEEENESRSSCSAERVYLEELSTSMSEDVFKKVSDTIEVELLVLKLENIKKYDEEYD